MPRPVLSVLLTSSVAALAFATAGTAEAQSAPGGKAAPKPGLLATSGDSSGPLTFCNTGPDDLMLSAQADF